MDYMLLFLMILLMADKLDAACSDFAPIAQAHGDTFYTRTHDRSYQVSKVVICEGDALGQPDPELIIPQSCNSTQCAAGTPSDYYIRVNRTLNLTTSPETAQGIFDMVAALDTRWPADFNQSRTWRVPGIGACLSEGEAGYWGMTPVTACVDGSVTGCGDGGPPDGTVVRACGVRVFPGANSTEQPVGDLRWVQTSGVQAGKLPPSEEANDVVSGGTSPDPGNDSSGTTTVSSLNRSLLAVVVFGGLLLIM